jgi:hypothetical protein
MYDVELVTGESGTKRHLLTQGGADDRRSSWYNSNGDAGLGREGFDRAGTVNVEKVFIRVIDVQQGGDEILSVGSEAAVLRMT